MTDSMAAEMSGAGDGFDFELRPGETLRVDCVEAEKAARHFRDVLGRFASGVTVVTAMNGDTPVGMTAQSFSSVSLEPPLVMFSPARTSRSWPLIERAGRFCVNMLAADQEWLSVRMASRSTDKFAGVTWSPAPETGSPLLAGVVAYVDCAVHAVYEAGDHHLVLARVLELGEVSQRAPLLFHRGAYGTVVH